MPKGIGAIRRASLERLFFSVGSLAGGRFKGLKQICGGGETCLACARHLIGFGHGAARGGVGDEQPA